MNYKKQIFAALAIAVTVSACSTHSTGTRSDNCMQIGCEDGLQFYQHEENSAITLPRRWYGVNGMLPEDFPPGSPQRKRIRELQIEKLRSQGLDAHGRPLSQ